MAYRVSYIFKQAGDYDGGWSENFWTRATTPNNAMAAAVLMKPLLMAVHGKQTRLSAIRIGPVDGGRRVAAKRFSMDANDNASVTDDSDIPTTRLQLVSRYNDEYQTLQWLGGIPDKVVEKGHYKPTGEYTTAMNALLAHLADNANNWGIRVLTSADTFKPIENLTNTGLVTVTGHGYDKGDRVLVSRTSGIDDANGEWLIDPSGADAFQLRDWGAAHDGADAVQNGRVKRQNYIMRAITSNGIGAASKHNVGRPSGQFTGRRRRR